MFQWAVLVPLKFYVQERRLASTKSNPQHWLLKWIASCGKIRSFIMGEKIAGPILKKFTYCTLQRHFALLLHFMCGCICYNILVVPWSVEPFCVATKCDVWLTKSLQFRANFYSFVISRPTRMHFRLMFTLGNFRQITAAMGQIWIWKASVIFYSPSILFSSVFKIADRFDTAFTRTKAYDVQYSKTYISVNRILTCP